MENHQKPEGSTRERMITTPVIMEIHPGRLPLHFDLRIETPPAGEEIITFYAAGGAFVLISVPNPLWHWPVPTTVRTSGVWRDLYVLRL